MAHETAGPRLRRILAREGLPSLGGFVRLDRAGFDAERETNEALAWSLVHFLRHNPEGKRDFFQKYFGRLERGDSPQEALGEADWARLDPLWRDHVKHMPG
jgi:hypothetical protein